MLKSQMPWLTGPCLFSLPLPSHHHWSSVFFSGHFHRMSTHCVSPGSAKSMDLVKLGIWWVSKGHFHHVINNEMFFAFLPAFNKPFFICHDILIFMAINVHAFFLLLIPPAQLVQPPLCCLHMDPTFPCSQPLLDLWHCHIVHNVLCTYLPFFCNFCEMQLNIPSEVFILRDWWVVIPILMERKLLPVKVILNPLVEILCMFYSMFHGLCYKNWGFLPWVKESSGSRYKFNVATIAVIWL